MNRPEHRLQTAVGKFVRSAVTAPHFFECYDRSANDADGRRHMWEAARHIKSGTPDTSLIVDGRVYRVELKAPGGKPTDRQWERIFEIQQAGAWAGWCCSVEAYGELLEAWGVPLAPNWRLQAQHHDAVVDARAAKKPLTKKRAREPKPSAARVRKVMGIMARVRR